MTACGTRSVEPRAFVFPDNFFRYTMETHLRAAEMGEKNASTYALACRIEQKKSQISCPKFQCLITPFPYRKKPCTLVSSIDTTQTNETYDHRPASIMDVKPSRHSTSCGSHPCTKQHEIARKQRKKYSTKNVEEKKSEQWERRNPERQPTKWYKYQTPT